MPREATALAVVAVVEDIHRQPREATLLSGETAAAEVHYSVVGHRESVVVEAVRLATTTRVVGPEELVCTVVEVVVLVADRMDTRAARVEQAEEP